MQTLDIISVNLWQMLASLANLVLLFLIVKKFLYGPVKKMLAERQSTIEGDYTAAKEAKEAALLEQQTYEEKMRGAKAEADGMIKSAAVAAAQREREILAEAKVKAQDIVRRAEQDAELERRKAEDSIKKEIVEVSSLLTEKMLGREVSAEDHQNLIDAFIEGLGDSDD